MSIQHLIRIISRVESINNDLQKKYIHQQAVSTELFELNESLKKLINYLNNLDHLKPNYTTNDIKPFMDALNLHLDILKGELEKSDFLKLSKSIKAVKIILHFHPTTYSLFSFWLAWIVEWIYFI